MKLKGLSNKGVKRVASVIKGYGQRDPQNAVGISAFEVFGDSVDAYQEFAWNYFDRGPEGGIELPQTSLDKEMIMYAMQEHVDETTQPGGPGRALGTGEYLELEDAGYYLETVIEELEILPMTDEELYGSPY